MYFNSLVIYDIVSFKNNEYQRNSVINCSIIFGHLGLIGEETTVTRLSGNGRIACPVCRHCPPIEGHAKHKNSLLKQYDFSHRNYLLIYYISLFHIHRHCPLIGLSV